MITYEPLWETLQQRGITTYKLLNEYHISRGMLDNLKHNRSITMNTLNQLCTMLDCDVTDIIRYQKEK
jgi:DNA-binding Xre family transcriptional regulator